MDAPLTVTQFNERVCSLVSTTDCIRNIEVTGEITELKRHSSGHVYFSLKDADSVVRCTLFRYSASRVRFELENGMKVTAFGSASYYAKGGSFGFNVESMSPAGKGEQQLALEKLTALLLSEGLFDEERKREIPRYPKVIGVVTSPTGAVIRDIIDTTARRYPVDILLSPAAVQGADAPASIIHAIKLLETQTIDVMIVGRGGGSAEDLSAFNDEGVVRAIAACKVPVISAVGHATDKSLCDRVADKYAETPTAAAMIATPDGKDEKKLISSMWVRMDNSLRSMTDRMRGRFDLLDHRLSSKDPKDTFRIYSVRLGNLSVRMDNVIGTKIRRMRGSFDLVDVKLDPRRMMEKVNQHQIRLDDAISDMDKAIDRAIDSKRRDLDSISSRLESLNPGNVLSRGYSFIRDGEGNVITSVNDLFPGTDVTIAMRDGTALAKIKELRRDE